jgi:hypothetical protein
MAELHRRVAFVCERCSSSLVRLDAWAEWNDGAQEWVLSTTYDYTYCLTCEAETRLVEVELSAAGGSFLTIDRTRNQLWSTN